MADLPDKYWHCRVKKANQTKAATIRELSFSELQSRVIQPYLSGSRFPIDGQIVCADQIDEIKIVHTPHDEEFNSQRFHDELDRSNANSGVIFIAAYPGPFDLDDSSDYTSEFLFSEDAAHVLAPSRHSGRNRSSAEVFVVHGHDDALRTDVCRVLEKLELSPIVLSEQADKGRTIIEKFEDHSDVAYAVVLITPDDHGGLIDQKDLKPRARQNVVFELGFFYGKLGRRRVCALVKEGVEFPSDIHGVIYKKADAAGAWKFKVATEMKAAGLDIDLNKLG